MTLADQPADVASDGARLLLRHPPYIYYMVSRSFSRFASQIAAVAVGWQIYDLTGSAFQLGMVGLAQFAPMLAASGRRSATSSCLTRIATPSPKG